MDWQPISSAPKDGAEFVAHDCETRTSHVTFWTGYCWHDPDNHYYSEAPEFVPTHWLPLPPPPKESTHDKG
ncbi:hypothetical protein M2336_001716 [Sphingobium sp. B1D7B]|nr:hypothetical protein [Sphingobium sp. B1D7B]